MSAGDFRLTDSGYATYKRIKKGRHAIGFVRLNGSKYIGVIGKSVYVGDNEQETFREVVARFNGFACYLAMVDRGAIKARIDDKPPSLRQERKPVETPAATPAKISARFSPPIRTFLQESDE